MVIIVKEAADAVPGAPGMAPAGYQAGVAPAPSAGVTANALPQILLMTPGALRRILPEVPNSMTSVLSTNPNLMRDPGVLNRLPDTMVRNGNIMGNLPGAMFVDRQTMDAWEKNAAFVMAMCGDPAFVEAASRDPEVNQKFAQMQAESTAAANA